VRNASWISLGYLRADGRLRPETGLRSLGETLQADDLEKCVELIKVHVHRLLDKIVKRLALKLLRL
jgi:hypothetical protein